MQFQQFTQRDGLSSNYVLSILQDDEGFLWIGTENGLNRFDGQHFLHFRTNPEDPATLDDNWVLTIFEDRRHNLWVGTNQGLNRLDHYTGQIQRIPLLDENEQPVKASVRAIREDSKGNLWVLTPKNGLYQLLLKSDTNSLAGRLFAYGEPFVNTRESLRLFDLMQLSEDELWVETSAGVDRLDLSTNTLERFPFPDRDELYAGELDQYTLAEDGHGHLLMYQQDQFFQLDTQNDEAQIQSFEVSDPHAILPPHRSRTMTLDHSGKVLLATGRNLAYLNVFNKELQVIHSSTQQNTDELFTGDIHAIHQDQAGNYWIGTAGGGLFLGSKQQGAFTFYQNEVGNPNSIPQGPVRSFVEDADSNLWVGIINYGLERFTLDGSNHLWKKKAPLSLSPRVAAAVSKVIKIMEGPGKTLWIASNTGGVICLDSTARLVAHYTHRAGDPNTISADRIWGLTMDQDSLIWIGTWLDGLNRLDPKSGQVVHFQHDPDDLHSLISDDIRFLFCDRRGELWIGTTDGLDRYDPQSNQFIHFQHDPNDPSSLSNNIIWSIFEDRNGYLWVGTDTGLNRYDRSSGRFTRFLEKDGLPDHTVYGILEDDDGFLWVSTENGLARQLSLESKVAFFPMTLENGLETASFVPKAYWNSTRNTQLYFGSSEGMLVVDPALIRQDTLQPRFALHALTTFNPYAEQDGISTDYFVNQQTGPIRLGYQDRSITFTLSDLNWKAHNKLQYEYQLTGFDRQWMPLAQDRQVTFTNLKPGRYRLLMRARDAENRSSAEIELSELVIAPPWWRTIWAYLLYIAGSAAIIYLLFRRQLRRQLEKKEVDNLRTLDAFKNQLFTNITHEFRTPLTIIQGMTDQIEKQPDRWLAEGAKMIRANSADLLDLVNQILELQKLESGQLEINHQLGDIVPYLETIFRQFQAYAHSKELQLVFKSSMSGLSMDFDPEKVLRIVSNLLSNAIKYTPEGGTITCSLATTEHTDIGRGESLLLTVADTGPGIPAEELPRIFDRFFQAEEAGKATRTGTGVGLSLTQGLVKLLGGRISVESMVGKGTTFQVCLPITRKAAPREPVEAISVQGAVFSSGQAPPTEQQAADDLPVVLIVEDNPDIAQYLQICLEGQYQLLVASDGQEGIDQAVAEVPDLIISDVMMPRKTGFELCETLKQDERTSHIPIILLTAKADVASRIAGLKQGADDYLGKPFHQEELLVRIANILATRQQLQARYQDLFGNPPILSPHPAAVKEDAFIQKLKEIVEQRMDDPDFDLDVLSSELFLSRSQLGRKIKALTGRSASIYLRSLRLQKARQLLLSTSASVKEVAYQVGFANPAYFSSSYFKEFGESPKTTSNTGLLHK